VRHLARDLPDIRSTLHRDMLRAKSERDRVAAAVVRLISKGFFRVGSERYVRENHTFGLVTLRKSHVRVEGDVLHFTYRGKGRKEQHHVVVDHALAHFVKRLLRTPGRRLFRYRTPEGEWSDLTRREVNEYILRRTGKHYTAKDFRTWGGTVRVATVLADLGPAASVTEARKNVVLAVRLTAAELGNTPAICRASYVHPIVLARYLDEGETIALPAKGNGRSASGHYPEERALIRFLDQHFPERRRRVRPEVLVAA
jgi:DNA topoisomerase-1